MLQPSSRGSAPCPSCSADSEEESEDDLPWEKDTKINSMPGAKPKTKADEFDELFEDED